MSTEPDTKRPHYGGSALLLDSIGAVADLAKKHIAAERNLAELLEAVGYATGQRLSTMPTAAAVAAAKAALARLTPVTFEGTVR